MTLFRQSAVHAIALIGFLAAPIAAQSLRYETGIVIGSDWLQANALPLEREAVHSGSVGASLRLESWSVDVNWLRIARDLSTVQGVSLSAGWFLHFRRLLFIPAIGMLGGQAQASRDTTGYDFGAVGSATAGHVPRYSYSSAATFGGNASLTVECAIYRGIGVRAVAQQWYFSGHPLEDDRSRTLVGAGVSLRVR